MPSVIAMTDNSKPLCLALPKPSRRRFLAVCGALLAAASPVNGVNALARARLSPRSDPSVNPGDFQQVVSEALHGQPWQASDAIKLEVPQLAENGAIVPVSVESLLPDTRRLLIFAEKNPAPLLAEFHFESGADRWVSLRVKLNESGPVLAIAEADGRYYGFQTTVRVMVGGCG